MLVLMEQPFDIKKDNRFGTSSTIIKPEQPLLQMLLNAVKARPQLFMRLQGPGCLNWLSGGN
jgi:hypothetical protein